MGQPNSGDISDTSGAAAARPPVPHRWPEGAVVYHVYPRSLQDSNGDGVGDLPGITGRLGYLKSLGVTAVWLSPFYPSPMADFGYDVADYCGVGRLFGTPGDFRQLLAEADRYGIKVMVDLVPNHTSDEHPWFRASRTSPANGYSDWYIWRDGHYDDDGKRSPPNNWLDVLGGQSAWEWNPAREQYYLHSFHIRQPDLNWSNPAVREAIKDVMRFWLELGVDGFRVDAVYWMAKDPLLRDDAPAEDYVEGEDSPYESLRHDNSCGWPAVYSHLNELAGVLKEPAFQAKPRFMVTEAYPERHNPVADYMAFYEGVDPEVAAPFNFEGIGLPWEAHAWHRFLKSFHAALTSESPRCVASYAFGNHDQSRLASRIGRDAARCAAVMLLTLPGMAFLYYGEELGMEDVAIPPDRVRDPAARGDPLKGQGRDPARTPMQWTAGPQAGFTEAHQPWLPVAPDYAEYNVETESGRPDSFLELYRTLGKLRGASDALRYGSIEVPDQPAAGVLAYERRHGQERLLVLANFTGQPVDIGPVAYRACLVSSVPARPAAAGADSGSSKEGAGKLASLQPHEAVVLRL